MREFVVVSESVFSPLFIGQCKNGCFVPRKVCLIITTGCNRSLVKSRRYTYQVFTFSRLTTSTSSLSHMIRKLPQQKGNSGDFFYRSKTCRIICTLFSYSINYLKYKVFFLSSRFFYLKLKISIISERTNFLRFRLA